MSRSADLARLIRQRAGPDAVSHGLILGSGLNALADEIIDPDRIDYADIPGFAVSTVQGHSGRLVFGNLAGREVVMMQGRVHAYEGLPMQRVTLPVRVMAQLGVRTLIVTNAAGGVNPAFKATAN